MTQLYYRELGSGEPLLILHGLLGSGDNWQRIAKELSGQYRVILPDARNHGRSPHTDSIPYSEMAEDLKALYRHLGINKANIIGHSMGGKTAMTFAGKYPELVDHLIVVDITPAAYSENNFAEIFAAMNTFDPATAQSRQEVEEKVALYIKDPLVRGFILKNLARQEGGGFRWKINLPVISRSLEGISAAISPGRYQDPALFIAGGKSDYINPERMESVNTAFPAAKVVTIVNAGHWVHYEAPEEFTSLVRDFLSS